MKHYCYRNSQTVENKWCVTRGKRELEADGHRGTCGPANSRDGCVPLGADSGGERQQQGSQGLI